MKKYDVLTEILMAYDELDRLWNENNRLHHEIEVLKGEAGYSPMERLCIERGRKELFYECNVTWMNSVHAVKDGETVRFTPYEEWLEIVRLKLPPMVSENEFTEYFEPEYRERYAAECTEAMKEVQ